MSQRDLPKVLWCAIGLIVASFLVLIGLQTYQALAGGQRLAQSRYWVVRTLKVISSAQAVNRALPDAERGARGHLITAIKAFYSATTKA